MHTRKSIKILLIITLFFCCFTLFKTEKVYAQSNDDSQRLTEKERQYIEDNDNSLWKDDNFVDPGFAKPEEDDGSDINQDDNDKYLDPDEVNRMQDYQYKQDLEMNLSKNKLEQVGLGLPANVLYGVGIGLIIGGWLALWAGENAREDFRYLGTGVVLGATMGFLVGTKPLYQKKSKAPPAVSKNESIWDNFGIGISPQDKRDSYSVAMSWKSKF